MTMTMTIITMTITMTINNDNDNNDNNNDNNDNNNNNNNDNDADVNTVAHGLEMMRHVLLTAMMLLQLQVSSQNSYGTYSIFCNDGKSKNAQQIINVFSERDRGCFTKTIPPAPITQPPSINVPEPISLVLTK